MQVWVLFAVIAGVGMTAYNLCAKFGGGQLPPPVFAIIMYLSGTALVIPIFLIYLSTKPDGYLQTLPMMPVIYSAMAGVAVVAVDLAVSRMFNLGAEVGLGMTSISIMSILFTAIIGYFFLKEGYSLINVAGLFFAMASIPMIFYGAK